MLKLSEFRQNHHPSEVRILAKFIRRGFSVIDILWGGFGREEDKTKSARCVINNHRRIK